MSTKMASYKSMNKDEGSNRCPDKDNEQMAHKGKVKLENNREKKNVLCNKGSENQYSQVSLLFLAQENFLLRDSGSAATDYSPTLLMAVILMVQSF